MRINWRTVALMALVFVVSAAVPLVSKALRFAREMDHIVITDVDVSAVADGTYQGICDVGAVAATVEVSVAGGRITGINLVRHLNGQGKAGEAVIGKVLESQSLDVQVISGATYSSKVILKAIENALRGG